MQTSEQCRELKRLREMMVDGCIPHEYRRTQEGMQLLYLTGKRQFIAAVVTEEQGRLWMRGMLAQEDERQDTVRGMTAEEAFARIKAHAEDKRRVG